MRPIMSKYQQWYNKFSISDIDPNELSANTFGTIVWDHKQKEIDELKALLVENIEVILPQMRCGVKAHQNRLDWCKRVREILK